MLKHFNQISTSPHSATELIFLSYKMSQDRLASESSLCSRYINWCFYLIHITESLGMRLQTAVLSYRLHAECKLHPLVALCTHMMGNADPTLSMGLPGLHTWHCPRLPGTPRLLYPAWRRVYPGENILHVGQTGAIERIWEAPPPVDETLYSVTMHGCAYKNCTCTLHV